MLVPGVVTFWLDYYALHRVHRSWGRGQCVGVERWSVRPVICPALRIKVGRIGRRHVLVFGRARRLSCWFEIQPRDEAVRSDGDAAVGPLPDIAQSVRILVRRQLCRLWRSRAGRHSDVLADRRLFEDETGRGCRHFVVLMRRKIWRLHCTLVTELKKIIHHEFLHVFFWNLRQEGWQSRISRSEFSLLESADNSLVNAP